ncbi:MAG TPA: hypothetical protein VF619_07885 [Allosphingosinicella sp.]|jgi:hypothetical protein
MSATITVDFAGGSAAATEISVVLANARFVLDLNQATALTARSGPRGSGPTNLSAQSGRVSIASGIGARLDATLALTIEWQPPDTPEITLNNMENPPNSPATVTWPTSGGPATQILAPGNPLPLNGLVPDSGPASRAGGPNGRSGSR